jgi:two-component system chemotaxis response regulator CheV
MSELLRRIDARTKLAGANKLEILLFTLGTDMTTQRKETFGINVFKVREVMRIPEITRAPEMPASVEGMVSLRGVLVPVIDLAKHIGIQTDAPPSIMIVTEYNGHTQGFLVGEVDTILRIDWSQMRVPPSMLTARMGGLVTAVTELDDKRLVMMLDVEKILSETTNFDDSHLFANLAIRRLEKTNRTLLYADDSSVARKPDRAHARRTRRRRHRQRMNGRQAWDELQKIADPAERPTAAGHGLHTGRADRCRNARDGRLHAHAQDQGRSALQRAFPVIMHSSLSSAPTSMGLSVGVDEYVSKFEPQRLAEVLTRLI